MDNVPALADVFPGRSPLLFSLASLPTLFLAQVRKISFLF